MANDWWTDNNSTMYNTWSNRMALNPSNPSLTWGQVSDRPSEASLDEYRKATGNNYVDRVAYQNFNEINSRYNTLSNFVDKMSMSNPALAANTSRLQGDAANFGSRLNSYLDASAPTASNTNRFDSSLSDAETRLKSLLDNPDSIQQSAAYKFRLKQGEDALQRQMGARGMLNSGNRLMELTKYGQDMGSQEYDAQANRLGNLLNTQTQSWLGDKNANTQRYLAESQAWNQRGGLLKDLVGNTNTAINQNQQIDSDARVNWAKVGVGLLPAAPTLSRFGGMIFHNTPK